MSNEGKACDAVLKVLEGQYGVKRSNVARPQRTEEKTVELTCTLGDQNFAFEHTRLESFPGQIQGNQEANTIFADILDALDENLPKPGVYSLFLPPDVRIGVPQNQLHTARNGLIAWISQQAAILHEMHSKRLPAEECPNGFVTEIRGSPPETPFHITLQREVHWNDSETNDGSLLIYRVVKGDIEPRREARVGKALDAKCPKLAKCKLAGATTVLVLEDNDMILSNHVFVGRALQKTLKNREDSPDQLYVVNTSHPKRWTVWRMKIETDCAPDEKGIAFDPLALEDLTNSDVPIAE
jgi:hypothetical protein